MHAHLLSHLCVLPLLLELHIYRLLLLLDEFRLRRRYQRVRLADETSSDLLDGKFLVCLDLDFASLLQRLLLDESHLEERALR